MEHFPEIITILFLLFVCAKVVSILAVDLLGTERIRNPRLSKIATTAVNGFPVAVVLVFGYLMARLP